MAEAKVFDNLDYLVCIDPKVSKDLDYVKQHFCGTVLDDADKLPRDLRKCVPAPIVYMWRRAKVHGEDDSSSRKPL